MSEKRFNIINDEWIGLKGAEYLTAIEDSNSFRKTVYFVYNENAEGICALLNKLEDECNSLDVALMKSHEVTSKLSEDIAELKVSLGTAKKQVAKKQANDCSVLNEYRQMVHSIIQSTYDECNGTVWKMNNLGFIDFAKKLGYDIK